MLFVSLLLSWVTAITLTPFFASLLFKDADNAGDDELKGSEELYNGLIFDVFSTILHVALKFRVVTVVAMVALLVSAVIAFGSVKQSFFPPSTTPMFLVDIWHKAGTDIRVNADKINHIEQHLLNEDGVEEVTSTVGQGLTRFMLTYQTEKSYATYAQLVIRMRDGEALEALLGGLKEAQGALAQVHGKYVPLFIKIAPDLSPEEVNGIAESLIKSEMDGVIATNTTLDREAVKGLEHANEAGGLSGEVLVNQSQLITEQLHTALNGKMPIIGVGGIHDVASAKARMAAGAELIQVYSSFIYQGPALIKQLVEGL